MFLNYVNAKLYSDRRCPRGQGRCSIGFCRPVRLRCATPPSSSGTPGAVSVGRTAVFAVSTREADVFASPRVRARRGPGVNSAKQSRAVASRVGIASSRGRSSTTVRLFDRNRISRGASVRPAWWRETAPAGGRPWRQWHVCQVLRARPVAPASAGSGRHSPRRRRQRRSGSRRHARAPARRRSARRVRA